jgi:hypothetical protein
MPGVHRKARQLQPGRRGLIAATGSAGHAVDAEAMSAVLCSAWQPPQLRP